MREGKDSERGRVKTVREGKDSERGERQWERGKDATE
jgi:hypothetical protein